MTSPFCIISARVLSLWLNLLNHIIGVLVTLFQSSSKLQRNVNKNFWRHYIMDKLNDIRGILH